MRRLPIVAGMLVLPCVVLGGETKIWDVSKRDALARGEEFENVILTSRGELKLGTTSTVVEVKDEPSFWCGFAAEDGILAGTGKGSIYRISGDKAEKVWETKEMLVSSFAASGGSVYAATIPNGKVFKRDGQTWKDFVTLESKYVWQLLAAPDGGLYAACGSPGAIYRIDSAGKATALFPPSKESPLKCENVLALHADGDALMAGTAAPGYLLRLEGGRPRVLHDFGEGEVKSIAIHGESWYVAVNSGAKQAPSDFLNAVEKAQEKKEEVQPKEPQAQPTPQPTPQPAPPMQDEDIPMPMPPPGGGAPAPGGGGGAQSVIWKFTAARSEREVEFPSSYITELAASDDGLYVGTNNSGRIFLLLPDGEHELLFDFPEGQVLGFVTSGRSVKGALMGSRASLRILTGERAKKGVYLSEVLDAKFPTMWGNLERRGTGGFTVQTRSGNIAKAGDGWSDWSEPAPSGPAKVTSPKGRYLQVRVTIEDPQSLVRGVSVAYKNENQRPRVQGLRVEALPGRQDGGFAPMGGERGPSPRLGEGHSLMKRLQWQGLDEDGDYVVFRIYYKPVDGGTWLPILGKESTPQFEYMWNTENVPDGRYYLRVVASDEKANAREEALTGSMDSEAVLIDNGKPELEIAISGTKVTGVATDRASIVTRVEYSVDGGEWHATVPKDRIFDDRREEFEFELGELARGAHTLTLRVLDRESNVGTLSRTFEVK